MASEVRSYRDLKVWQAAISVAEHVYGLTKSFPQSELYGLTSQMRRAAVSVAANIAEGHGRETSRYYVNCLRVSQGSLKELETHVIVAQGVGVASLEAGNAILAECDEVGRMLRALIRAIQEKANAND